MLVNTLTDAARKRAAEIVEHQGDHNFATTPEDRVLMLALIENGYVGEDGFRYYFKKRWTDPAAEKEFLALTDERERR